MSTQAEQLDYNQLVTLWEIAGKPEEGDVLINLLSQGTNEAIVAFFGDAPYEFSYQNSWDVKFPERILHCMALSVEFVGEEVAQSPDIPDALLAELCKSSDLAVGWHARTGSRTDEGKWRCPAPASVILGDLLTYECVECGEECGTFALYTPDWGETRYYCSECEEWLDGGDMLADSAERGIGEGHAYLTDGRWGEHGIAILTPEGISGFPAFFEANQELAWSNEALLEALPSDFTVDLGGLPTITREGGVVIRREINPSTTE